MSEMPEFKSYGNMQRVTPQKSHELEKLTYYNVLIRIVLILTVTFKRECVRDRQRKK